VPVLDGAAVSSNTYPLRFVFDAGRDGRVEHAEDVHVNWIARRAIRVDGQLDDWKDLLPQTVAADGSGGPTLTEAAWFPFQKFDTAVTDGLATAYLACDASNFYFAARIADSTPEDGMVRFETRDDDAYFYPEICYARTKTNTVQELTWPAGVRRYSYRRGPELPAGNAPRHDNVQIAFNVLPPDEKPWYPCPPGTMPGFIGYYDTDYEYALNPVAAQYGGGVEIWRLRVPGMPHKHFYPREPKSPYDGPVKDGRLVIRRDGNMRIVEAAIPWREIPEVKRRIDAGQTIKFSYRVNDNGSAACLELARGRSVAKRNGSFLVDWTEHWRTSWSSARSGEKAEALAAQRGRRRATKDSTQRATVVLSAPKRGCSSAMGVVSQLVYAVAERQQLLHTPIPETQGGDNDAEWPSEAIFSRRSGHGRN